MISARVAIPAKNVVLAFPVVVQHAVNETMCGGGNDLFNGPRVPRIHCWPVNFDPRADISIVQEQTPVCRRGRGR